MSDVPPTQPEPGHGARHVPVDSETTPPHQPESQPSTVPALIAFLLAIGAAVGLGIVYSLGGQTQWEGALLGIALGGIGVGLVLWAKGFFPDEVVVEDRPSPASDAEDLDQLFAVAEAGEGAVGRRNVLGWAFGGAVAAVGAVALFPVRSLGPDPTPGLKTTPFAAGGLRLVDEVGNPVTPQTLSVNGVLTVFPEGFTDAEDGQTLLIHLREAQVAEFVSVQPDKADWLVQDHIAFSKICTHAGCPVGLYEERDGNLLCPCHQSTFDVNRGAKPIFGPAARPRPQLQLALDQEGFLIAPGDFESPVGPGFWNRGR